MPIEKSDEIWNQLLQEIAFGASQQNSVAAFSWTTDVDGDKGWLMKRHDPKLIWKYVV